MLTLLNLFACGSPDLVPVDAAKPERKHHVERTDRGGARSAEDEEEVERESPTGVPGDRAPVVKSIVLRPATPSRLDTLTVSVDAKDPDGGPVTTEYHWFIDDAEVSGHNEPSFDLHEYARGTKVQLTVRVRDSGNEVRGTSQVLTVNNADPHFKATPQDVRRFDGFRIETEDADGDSVTLKMSGGPEGSSVDSGGVLRYAGSEGEKGGHYNVKITLDDGHGGKGTMELPLDVSAGSGTRAPPEGVPKAPP